MNIIRLKIGTIIKIIILLIVIFFIGFEVGILSNTQLYNNIIIQNVTQCP
jgi:hypothetical protein